jgi:hypothetical protein
MTWPALASSVIIGYAVYENIGLFM